MVFLYDTSVTSYGILIKLHMTQFSSQRQALGDLCWRRKVKQKSLVTRVMMGSGRVINMSWTRVLSDLTKSSFPLNGYIFIGIQCSVRWEHVKATNPVIKALFFLLCRLKILFHFFIPPLIQSLLCLIYAMNFRCNVLKSA